jgi:predicted small secreted protein
MISRGDTTMTKPAFALLAALFLAGRNTIEGAGEDMRNGGQAIEKAAR